MEAHSTPYIFLYVEETRLTPFLGANKSVSSLFSPFGRGGRLFQSVEEAIAPGKDVGLANLLT
jgi:hypothetical protein